MRTAVPRFEDKSKAKEAESQTAQAEADSDAHEAHGHEHAEHDSDHAHDDHGHDHSHTEGDHEGHSHDHAHAGELTMADSKDHFLNDSHLFGHVQDADYIELPKFLGYKCEYKGHEHSGVLVPNLTLLPDGYGKMSKFMLLILVAAVLLTLVFGWLARKIKSGGKPRGRAWNLLEAFVCFIRDEVAIPAMGKKDAKRFLPFLLTLFFFILTLNLFGMIPFLGSATGSLAVTAGLALATFAVTVGSGIKKMGVAGFLKAQVPSMDLPPALSAVLVPAIWAIEMFGLLVKHAVLAIRLFANMLAGHLVLAIFIAFIGVVSVSAMSWGVAPIVVLASIALSMLELFVAFLQAYVFTFLASLFIGSAQHAH